MKAGTCRIRLACGIFVGALIIAVGSARLQADGGTCGGAMTTVPFTDVGGSIFFCAIAEAYFSGLTNGTSATTYSPAANVTRDQMAAFITRTQDSTLRRGSKRAALDQYWTTTPRYAALSGGYGTTTVGKNPAFVKSDGEDLWVANFQDGTVSRVHASDGKLLGNWTGATGADGVLVAMGLVFLSAETSPGKLYAIDPTKGFGPVSEVTGAGLGNDPEGIAFDGSRIWTANSGSGSVSIITPGSFPPWPVTNVPGFGNPSGLVFDSSNIWVTDNTANTLLKLDQNGAVIQTVGVGHVPRFPAFDGTNIWVPNNNDSSVSVVRASTGVVIATLTGNGLALPTVAAFDGQRILVTNRLGDTVSLWRAADLTPIGSLSTGTNTGPFGACSDGINFWITLANSNQLARF